MSFANFGIGLGAFAQGLNSGIDTGSKLHGLYRQGQLRRAQKQGMDDAKAARSSAIDSLVQVGSAPNADNTMTMPTYSVGDQTYASQDEARKAAEGQVGSLEDFYAKVAVPKIYEKYMEIDPEKARIWKKLNDSEQFQRGRSLWARGVRAAALGDYDNAGKFFMQAYNTDGYFDDGNTIKEFKAMKDKDGNYTGVRITMKMANGEEVTTDMDAEKAMRLGAMFGDPEKVMEAGLTSIRDADKARLELAKEQRKDQAQLERSVILEEIKAANQAKLVDIRAKAEQEYRKGTAPEEVARMIERDLLNADTRFARLPRAEKDALIAETMRSQRRIGEQFRGGAQGGNPLSGGLGGQAPAGAPMIYDTKTGRMVPYQR